MRERLQYLLPAGFAVSIVACSVAALLLPVGAVRVVAMLVAVVAFATWARSFTAAMATAAMAWMFTTGFLVNGTAELTITGTDAWRLAAFAAVGLVGWACGILPSVAKTGLRTLRTRPVIHVPHHLPAALRH
ncbi:hypothetical protein AB0B45_44040 [Nonomuraea sp. NPDC049152]|uniref:hypothetical protein n=1 Tax=Nonomuraea sp. NPDC049152 TaxID=3154350 RepID=UPI0033EB89ED